jgi:hypothetical protein
VAVLTQSTYKDLTKKDLWYIHFRFIVLSLSLCTN